MEAIFEIVEGDTLPTIDVTWDGVDLTGYSLTLQVMQGDTLLEVAGVIDDASAGSFHFQVASDDLVPGIHEARIKSDDGSDGVQTFRGFKILVPRVFE
jgi:hypothetical protein